MDLKFTSEDLITTSNPTAGNLKLGYPLSGAYINKLCQKTNAGVISPIGGTITDGKWINLVLTTDYATAPPSTSTITMNTDQTANIKAGMALKYTIGGVTYYGVATTVAAGLLTIAGAPLGGNITDLYYSPLAGSVEMVAFIVSSTFADAASTALLDEDVLTVVKWDKQPAYCVKQEVIVITDDSGANQPRVNVTIAGSAVNTSNGNTGLEVAETWVNSVVDINTTNYSIVYGEAIELTTDANGTNDDASDLTCQLTFVYA